LWRHAQEDAQMDSWGQVKKLTASDAQNYVRFGSSIAISRDTAAVVEAINGDGDGLNRGVAYIFERNRDGADNWNQVTKLAASDDEDHDAFGHSVAVNGDTVVVGAAFADGASADPGAAYLYQRNQGGADSWGQVEKLTASDAGASDYFGRSVGISGATIIIGAYGANAGAQTAGRPTFLDHNLIGSICR
jgi:hypothetical protein